MHKAFLPLFYFTLATTCPSFANEILLESPIENRTDITSETIPSAPAPLENSVGNSCEPTPCEPLSCPKEPAVSPCAPKSNPETKSSPGESQSKPATSLDSSSPIQESSPGPNVLGSPTESAPLSTPKEMKSASYPTGSYSETSPPVAPSTTKESVPVPTSPGSPGTNPPSAVSTPQGGQPPLQYNIDLPTGDQRQAVYFTKDLTFKVGTTEIGFYGFFKGDLLSETRITGNTANVRPSLVPFNNDLPDKHTQTLFDARDSRIGIKIEDTFNSIKMKGAIEFDFFTTDGDAIQNDSRHARIRVAYATAELPSHFFFLTGQYYTLAMHYPEIDMPTRVNLINFPAGVVNSRQPQYRVGYKQYFSPTRLLQFEFNGELQGYNTTGIVTAKGGDTAQGGIQKWPLFTAKIMWLSKMFKWSIAASRGEAYVITSSTLGTRLHTPVWGAISTASFTWQNLLLWGTVHHWVGLTGLTSNYLSQLTLINSNRTLRALKANGWCAALRYDFLPRVLWVDALYGTEYGDQINGSTTFSGASLRKLKDLRVNIIGAFWKHWQIGAEWERNWVEAFNGNPGRVDMVHIGVWYVFGQP